MSMRRGLPAANVKWLPISSCTSRLMQGERLGRGLVRGGKAPGQAGQAGKDEQERSSGQAGFSDGVVAGWFSQRLCDPLAPGAPCQGSDFPAQGIPAESTPAVRLTPHEHRGWSW
jgi:hypothetical protein